MKLLLVLVMLTACAAVPQDLSGKMFTFSRKSTGPRVELITSQQSFSAITVCFRFMTDLKRDHGLFSMATPSNPNDFLIFWDGHNNKLQFHAKQRYTSISGINYKPNMWHSVCATWDSESGLKQLWFDGQPSVRYQSGVGPIDGRPIIILGQEQDSHGSGFDLNQCFIGMISDVHMWDHVLHSCDIQNYANELDFPSGNVLNWRALEFKVVDNVLIEDKFVNSCQASSI